MKLDYFIFVLLVCWNLVLSFLYFSSIRHYKSLSAGSSGYSLHEILESLLKKFSKSEEKLLSLEKTVSDLSTDNLKNVANVGLVRYNPFEDTGGDQSFSLAILDRCKNGVVVSSLHGRSGTRIYSKGVKAADKDLHELSKEEKEAILLALSTKF